MPAAVKQKVEDMARQQGIKNMKFTNKKGVELSNVEDVPDNELSDGDSNYVDKESGDRDEDDDLLADEYEAQHDEDDSGNEVECIVYVAKEDWIEDGLKPTHNYQEHILHGAPLLSEDYLDSLKNLDTID